MRIARKYYSRVLSEGGDYGKRLLGHYMIMARQNIYKKRIFYVSIVAFVIIILLMIRILPLKEFNTAGLKKGLIHSLFFLPGAAIFTTMIFYLTDPTKANINGREPYLVLIFMIITFLAIVFNGFVLEADEREEIKFPLYLVTLGLFIICVNYIMFYLLDLVTIIERFII